MEGVKEALEWPTNIGKEEHITVTCLYAFIIEISLDCFTLLTKAFILSLQHLLQKVRNSQIRLKCNNVFTQPSHKK